MTNATDTNLTAAQVIKLTWERTDQDEWEADLPCGGWITISRVKAARFDDRGCRGLVTDHCSAWQWHLVRHHADTYKATVLHVIKDGASVRDAKKAAAATVKPIGKEKIL